MFGRLLIAALVVGVTPALAADWSFDDERGWASVASGDARLLVTCAGDGQLGFVYELPDLDAAVEAAGDGTEFMLSLDGATWSKVENGVAGGGDRPYYLAMVGGVADDWIRDTARAAGSVFVAIGVPNADGSNIYNISEFSAAGSSKAIAAVRDSC